MSTQTSGPATDGGAVDNGRNRPKATIDRRRIGSRVLWASGAQVSSSATNLTLYVGILASTDTEGLGRWVAVLGVYHLALALARSLASEPMVAAGRASAEDGAFTWTWARRRHQMIGVAAGVGAGLVGWLIEADPITVIGVGVATPALLAQDGFRYLAWAGRRPVVGVAIDLVWLAVTGAVMVALVVADAVTPVSVVWAWLGGGLVGAVVGRLFLGHLLRSAARHVGGIDKAVEFGADDPRHGRRVSHGMLVTARNLLPVVVALVVGPAPAGLLKAALLPFTPILTLFAGLRIAMLPAMQRAADVDAGDQPTTAPGSTGLDRFLRRLVLSYAAVAVPAVLVTIAAVAVVSDRRGLLGSLSPETVRLGGALALMSILGRPVAEAVALGRPRVSAPRRRLAEIGLEWGGVFSAALLVDPDRVVVGWVIGMAAGALLWVVGVRRRPPEGVGALPITAA